MLIFLVALLLGWVGPLLFLLFILATAGGVLLGLGLALREILRRLRSPEPGSKRTGGLQLVLVLAFVALSWWPLTLAWLFVLYLWKALTRLGP